MALRVIKHLLPRPGRFVRCSTLLDPVAGISLAEPVRLPVHSRECIGSYPAEGRNRERRAGVELACCSG
jgi:hypothetical protein